ncbi:DUF6942 family protein [Shewanella gaetbuli]|uniref:Uncharacterized protein n=1 Tax=Shewanella gaetbuli TaxID=220752 RepID=A0A9X1ZMX8_9GAMM|nr:hypothetical protein [Shewanella gaetbuli]MCL1143892.1 hypothetical protein [Shewanella gaetbuli]
MKPQRNFHFEQVEYIQYFGSSTPEVLFYLPTPALIPHQWRPQAPDALEQLIHLNGNHWRKIINIICKIVCHNPNSWREIKPVLLQQSPNTHKSVAIVVVDAENLTKVSFTPQTQHIVCSKKLHELLTNLTDKIDSIEKYSIEELVFNQRHKIQLHPPVYFTPYLDYRQFPNGLIDLLRKQLHPDVAKSDPRQQALGMT